MSLLICRQMLPSPSAELRQSLSRVIDELKRLQKEKKERNKKKERKKEREKNVLHYVTCQLNGTIICLLGVGIATIQYHHVIFGPEYNIIAIHYILQHSRY